MQIILTLHDHAKTVIWFLKQHFVKMCIFLNISFTAKIAWIVPMLLIMKLPTIVLIAITHNRFFHVSSRVAVVSRHFYIVVVGVITVLCVATWSTSLTA